MFMPKRLLIFLWLLCGHSIVHAQNTLQYYIGMAEQNSPLLNDSKNQNKASELELQRLKAFFTKPQMNVVGNYLLAPIVSTDNGSTSLELNSNGANKYFGYDLGQSNGGLYQGLVTFIQPLFSQKRYNTFAGQVKVGMLVNQNNILLTKHDIEKIVTDQYILCLFDKKQMDFAYSMMILLNDQLAVVKKLAENGVLKQSDVTLLNIEYESNQNLVATYKATYRRDLMDLNILCGIKDTTFVQLPNIQLELSAPLIASNYLERYRLDSLNLVALQKVFETKYKPQVNFFTNAGLNAVYMPTIPNRFGFSTGLSIVWNFYDSHQKNIMRRKTNIQLQTVSFYRNNFIVQNTVRVNKFLNELQSYTERANIAQKQLDEYQALLSSYKKEILQGQLSIINYLITLKNMTMVKRDYLLLETNRLLLINAYNYWNW